MADSPRSKSEDDEQVTWRGEGSSWPVEWMKSRGESSGVIWPVQVPRESLHEGSERGGERDGTENQFKLLLLLLQPAARRMQDDGGARSSPPSRSRLSLVVVDVAVAPNGIRQRKEALPLLGSVQSGGRRRLREVNY